MQIFFIIKFLEMTGPPELSYSFQFKEGIIEKDAMSVDELTKHAACQGILVHVEDNDSTEHNIENEKEDPDINASILVLGRNYYIANHSGKIVEA